MSKNNIQTDNCDEKKAINYKHLFSIRAEG
jgi:hypothetical protein